MSSDEDDLVVDGRSESEEEKIKTASPLKVFNLKTVDDLLGSILLIIPPLSPSSPFHNIVH